MKKVFIVDDSYTNLALAKDALEGKYRSFALPSAEKMFKLMEKVTPDIILLDVDMPEMDGFEAMGILKSDVRYKSIPVIFLTARNNVEAEITGLELGAIDFINKPFAAPVLLRRIETHIGTDMLIKEAQCALRNMNNAIISIMANMVENRDMVTSGHVERTQTYLKLLIDECIRTGAYAEEISKWDLEILIPSAQMHDVGKISISDVILNKPDKLSKDEFAIIETHCAVGEEIIDYIIRKTNADSFLIHAKRFAGYHHEKWDGTGYPRKLAGYDIPLEGRVMAVVDVYDALLSERPYKKPLSHQAAVEIVKNGKSTHFDPLLVDAFLNIEETFCT